MATRTPPLLRVAGVAGGAVVVAYGGYYLTLNSQVSALRTEQQRLETRMFVAQGKSRRSESDLLETESLIKALGQQAELVAQSRQHTAQQLEAARAALQALEAQQEQQDQDIQRIHQDLDKARTGLATHRQAAVRFKEEARAVESSLVALKGDIAASQQRLNPLQHPWVKELMGRK